MAAEAYLAAISYHASSTACAQAALFPHTHPPLQTKTGSSVHLQGVRAALDNVPTLPCCVPARPRKPESRRCCHTGLMRLQGIRAPYPKTRARNGLMRLPCMKTGMNLPFRLAAWQSSKARRALGLYRNPIVPDACAWTHPSGRPPSRADTGAHSHAEHAAHEAGVGHRPHGRVRRGRVGGEVGRHVSALEAYEGALVPPARPQPIAESIWCLTYGRGILVVTLRVYGFRAWPNPNP